MKKLLLLCGIILCTTMVFAQTKNSEKRNKKQQKEVKEKKKQEIPKGTNTIVITTTDSSKLQTLQNLSELFLDENIEIDKCDEKLFYLSSKPFDQKGNTIKLLARVKEEENRTIILLSGSFCANLSITLYGVTAESSFIKIEYTGMKGSPYRKAFECMQNIANKILNKDLISYEKK